MNMETTIVARPERLTDLAELLKRFERDDMEHAVDLLIAVMDAADGDTDAEPHSDEDACGAHDDDPTYASSHHLGAGDDTDAEYVGDEKDVAWIERTDQTRGGGRPIRAAAWANTGRDIGTPEDAEDDDGSDGYDEREPEHDGAGADTRLRRGDRWREHHRDQHRM